MKTYKLIVNNERNGHTLVQDKETLTTSDLGILSKKLHDHILLLDPAKFNVLDCNTIVYCEEEQLLSKNDLYAIIKYFTEIYESKV